MKIVFKAHFTERKSARGFSG